MKRMACLFVLPLGCLGLPLAGCMAEVLTTTAIQGELQARQLSAAKKQIEHAQGVSGETQITQAIKLYQAEKGYYPPSLEALVPAYLDSVPTRPDGAPYGYDVSTGQLLQSAPAGALSAVDYQTLEKARAAVQQFGADTTWYPTTLADLVPKYLPAMPTTQDGRAFVYNNQTGEVLPPGQTAAAPRPAASPGYSAPAAEMATGLGIQQELNNMSSAGVNSAASGARRNVVNVGAGQDRAMKAADQLGL